MVRVRFVDPLPSRVSAWMEVPFLVGRNPNFAWLMNYAAATWEGRRRWLAEACDGAGGRVGETSCPRPVPGTRDVPGTLGDMLLHVGVPVWVEKSNDPAVRGGGPIVPAGLTTAYSLTVSTHPRPGDPAPPEFPPSARAVDVMVTDTIPVGLTYEPGSATIDSEDLNGNGLLDPGEDRNGNGRIDADVPFEPIAVKEVARRETTLSWFLGDLPYEVRAPTIRYAARVSRLVPAGTTLVNWATAAGLGDPFVECRRTYRNDALLPFAEEGGARGREHGRLRGARPVQMPDSGRNWACVWAQILVSNTAMAQVEKIAPKPWIDPGEPFSYTLGLASLDTRAVEWFDAVDLLPRPGEPRSPETRLAGEITEIIADTGPGWHAIEVWASATSPEVLDTRGGAVRDGLVDPVSAWGGGGAGLGGEDWPCRLDEVGTARCREIRRHAEVTALRFWGPDPEPDATGGVLESFLPAGSPPRHIRIVLDVPQSRPGDLAHNAWGGRFEGLPLPVFDGAVIRVRSEPTPTPTVVTPARPTATPTPSETPSPVPRTPETATPTATPQRVTVTAAPPATPSRFTVYLPVALRYPCVPQPVDVVLVIDASTSMARDVGDGRSKLEAVREAVSGFLDRFAPEGDRRRVAVVGFNDRAWLAQPLTGDRAMIDRAIEGLRDDLAEGTRLDLGLEVGAEAVAGGERDRLRTMIFLTDGLPNRVPTPSAGGRQEDTVLAMAESVRARGVIVHAVGFGRADAPDLADRIAPELLRTIAGDPSRYHEAADGATLAEVFRDLSRRVRCPSDVRWP